MKLFTLLMFLSQFTYSQTKLDIVNEINKTLSTYSEMCDGNIDAYKVQFSPIDENLTINICQNEKISFDLKTVSILFLDEKNDLNYSICFKCIDDLDCITKDEEIGFKVYKISLIFPDVTKKIVQNFSDLKK